MITYNSNKFNNIIKKITKILLNHNINIKDPEAIIEINVIEEIQSCIEGMLEKVEKFVNVPCPKCGKKHLIPMQATYKRNVKFKVGNILITIKITVARLKCENCGSTHAILPCICIPYKQISKQAILEIASEADQSSTEAVADNLNIDAKQVRRMVNIVRGEKNNILVMYAKEPYSFNKEISNESNLSDVISALKNDFDIRYFKEYRKPFLLKGHNRKIYIEYGKLSF